MEGAALLEDTPRLVNDFRKYMVKVCNEVLVPVYGMKWSEDGNALKQLE